MPQHAKRLSHSIIGKAPQMSDTSFDGQGITHMLFDWLVTGHVLEVNPAHAVRGPKYVVRKGKTPVLTAEEARELLRGDPGR